MKEKTGLQPREMYFAVNLDHLLLIINMMIANDVTEEQMRGNYTPHSYKIGLIANGKTY